VYGWRRRVDKLTPYDLSRLPDEVPDDLDED
jgi:hypothetical protein